MHFKAFKWVKVHNFSKNFQPRKTLCVCVVQVGAV